MARRVEVEVTVGPSGEVTFQVKGAKGKSCLDVAKPLEDALGEVAERKFTSEYYEAEAVAQRREIKK